MIIIDLHFLPSIEYFCALQPFDEIILEKYEHYVKQSYRNRCFILATHGPERLTVPITKDSGNIPYGEIRIDYSYRWQNNFWRTIESAYANAPYFEHYRDELQAQIFSNQEYLFELNLGCLSMCLHWLKWDKTLSATESFEKEVSPPCRDMRGLISGKKGFSERDFYRPSPYRQVFGSDFAPNLSMIDLIFCEGPHAATVIDRSRTELND